MTEEKLESTEERLEQANEKFEETSHQADESERLVYNHIPTPRGWVSYYAQEKH